MRTLMIVASIGWAAAGCAKERAAPAAPAAARPAVAVPAHLQAWVSIPSIAHGFDGLAAFLAHQPPTWGQVDATTVRAALGGLVDVSLEGVDVERPAWILPVQAPAAAEPTYAIMVHVADAAALQAAVAPARLALVGDRAVIGPPDVLAQVATWAHEALADQPVAPQPTAVVRPAVVLGTTGARFLAGLRQGAADHGLGPDTAITTGAWSALSSLLAQSDRIEARLDANAQVAVVDVQLALRPGTAWAAWVDAQRPSAFALVARLPYAPDHVLLSGRIAGGAAADVRARLETGLATMGVPPDVVPYLRAFLDAASGEVAFGTLPGHNATLLVGLDDAEAARAAIAALTPADGPVPWSIWEDFLGIALAGDEPGFMDMVAAAGNPRPLPDHLAARVRAAAARRASLLLLVDVGGTAAPGQRGDLAIAAEVAFEETTARLRITVPAEAALPALVRVAGAVR